MSRQVTQNSGGSSCAGCLIMLGIGIFIIALGLGALTLLGGGA